MESERKTAREDLAALRIDRDEPARRRSRPRRGGRLALGALALSALLALEPA